MIEHVPLRIMSDVFLHFRVRIGIHFGAPGIGATIMAIPVDHFSLDNLLKIILTCIFKSVAW